MTESFRTTSNAETEFITPEVILAAKRTVEEARLQSHRHIIVTKGIYDRYNWLLRATKPWPRFEILPGWRYVWKLEERWKRFRRELRWRFQR